jgi:hypothetical protein
VNRVRPNHDAYWAVADNPYSGPPPASLSRSFVPGEVGEAT